MIGPTGEFPAGIPVCTGDHGELKFSIESQAGSVVVRFGAPVAYLGLTPQVALEVAQSLIETAEQALNACPVGTT